MKLRNILIISLCLFVGVAFAAEPPPLKIMKTTSSRMLSALQRNKSRLHSRKVIHRIVRKIVLPKMDVTTIARSVVGRQYWSIASRRSRKQFISTFTSYVIDMYSTALSAFSDEVIRFRPMRTYSSAMSRVRIYSQVQRPGRPPVSLNYRMLKRGSTWKIYDFSVGGVSMVRSYRAQFADTLNNGGLKLLVRKLQSRYKR